MSTPPADRAFEGYLRARDAVLAMKDAARGGGA